ncbi:putative DHH superfamily phosphohydrolase [Haloferax elongans ATCC BAA-1513]|uniref:Putative DHH superfamily phosphohydrolase n=1 Tax=Haloferax elongans ATCC BAA-1513 TaxID=1230453 RepID=M0HAX7_HALEO|nr:DHH superfamily phosphohydrolase [Haloferax elongans]ELZ80943.1 putative DHH superfamily phosphohydrolase [Haloferax elongans ATCC BAA-1513]
MEEELIDSSRLSLPRKSVLPGTGFFYPDDLDEERAEERAKEELEDAEVAVVTDTDADGLGCVALLREVYDAALDVADFEERIEERLAEARGEVDEAEEDEEAEEDRPESPVALMGSSPYSLEDDLLRVAEYAPEGIDVFVCDLCPDRYEYVEEELEALAEVAGSIRWFDHHQWKPEVAEQVRAAGVDLVVGESDEECSTDVALRELDYEFDDRFVELAAVTRDHDLWLNEDERSQDLADYAYWTGKEEYVAIVGAYGADLPEVVEEYIAHRRVEKENLIETAVSRAEFKSVGDWTVGITYGRCSQNEVADALREEGADAAVIVKPAGSASIRGSEDFERAHEVAGLVNGGGHPKAAGCKPDIYDDMLDYAHHWTTQGATTKRVILNAFERVAETPAEGEDKAEETADAGADADADAETDADDAETSE